MSFRISVRPSRRAAIRLVSDVREQLTIALEEAKAGGRTQADVARELDVNRSVIHRFVSGSRDMMVGTLAEVAWALDREVTITVGPAQAGIKAHDIAAEAAPATTLISPKDEARKYAYAGFKSEESDPTTARPKLGAPPPVSAPTGRSIPLPTT